MTDAIVPETTDLTRSTDLPAMDRQATEDGDKAHDLLSLRHHPGWRAVLEKLERWEAKYRSPEFPKEMSYEEVGKEYLLSQQMATMLREVIDDVQQDQD